jgi:predicted ribosomally synthesized peptide with nif11-like leader
MSVENAKAFYERMVGDEAFRSQYQNATSEDDRRKILLAEGYGFTPEEWETASAEIAESSQGEISDAELEAVSGGRLILPMYGAPGIPGWPGSDPIIWPGLNKKQ